MRIGRWFAATLGVVALAGVALIAGRAAGDSGSPTPAGLVVNGPVAIPLDGGGLAVFTSPAFDVPQAADPANSFRMVLGVQPTSGGFNWAAVILNGRPVFQAPGPPTPGYPTGVHPSDSYVFPVALRPTGNSLILQLQGLPNGNAKMKIECVPQPPAANRPPVLRELCIATMYISKKVDGIVAIRNDNDGAPIGARLLLFAPNGTLVTTSDTVIVPPEGRVHMSVSQIVIAKASTWLRGSVKAQIVGRGSAEVCADAVEANRADVDAASRELKGNVPGTTRNLPVEDKGTRPITPEQATQFLGD